MTNRDHQERLSTSRPRGPLAWMRRKIFPRLARLSAFIGILTLAAWITGRVLTDQYHWSQYLWWIPAVWMIGGAWVCLLCSTLLALWARRLGGLFLRPVLLVGCVACTGYLFLGVWHAHRYLRSNPVSEDSIRIVHWNQAGFKADQSAWANHVLSIEVDLVLVANSRWGKERRELLQSLSPLASAEELHMVTKGFNIEGLAGHFRIFGDALIASKYPIVRTATVTMGSKQDQESVLQRGSDYGWVTLIELDLSSDENIDQDRLVVWFVDLPSNPSLWRQQTMRAMRESIDRWNGVEYRVHSPDDKRSVWKRYETEGSFPTPDVVIGDFNAINGSDSINQLITGYMNAYDTVGRGPSGSWRPKIGNQFLRQPFKIANWHIDLAFTSSDHEIFQYSIIDARPWGSSEHKMQILEVSP